MAYAKDYNDLEVYQKSRILSKTIFEITSNFPKEEKYSLVDQIRRSSRSVGAQIAEAWGKRRYNKHFVLKLTDSHAEQLETQHWIDISLECSYINKTEHESLTELCASIGRMLYSMIEKSDSFCQHI
ncbi:MAG: four helix bundle protein [Bacteroidota bacterium]